MDIAAFFLGLKFGFVLIVIAMEFYFCVFTRYIDREIEPKELFFLGLTTFLCMLSSFPLSNFSIGLWAVFPLPVLYLIFRVLEKRGVDLEYRSRIERKLGNLKENAKRNPHIPAILVEIGDVYFMQKKYDEALSYYYKARYIKESADLIYKIRIAEREEGIQKRNIMGM